ncbi:hypothetical protein M8R20_14235 [Pseudomonas sp. R2.Fl]|nr:hypothetical protein [Pseudomonas sp. R2.Fl]
MKTLLIALLTVSAVSPAALAATVINAGSAAVVIVVVEGGNRVDLPIDAGQSQTICPAGCFVTLPNGDRIGLEGGETIEIKDGSATIR